MTATIVPRKITESESASANAKPGLIDKMARGALLKLLSGLIRGKMTLAEGGRVHEFGATSKDFSVHARIDVHDPRFYRQVLFGGSIGAGEAYMAGHWTAESLTDVVRVVIANQMVMKNMDRGWSRLTMPFHKIFHVLNRNTIAGSRMNILAHYDLGNDFYSMFLDPSMTYSCALFENEHSTLQEASLAKYDRLCRKLEIGPNDHVLEIGAGWGGFAVHAAEKYGCRITTTTISDRQYAFAEKRIREAGLSRLVTVLKKDYRDLQGSYDKLVSIEMIEAVGHQYYKSFFGKCGELLKPDGMLAMQAITISDHAFEEHKRTVDFIRRYIFPGGCIPSVTALNQAAADASDMKLFHLDDIAPHYARTLKMWRERFFRNVDKVRAMGFPETFVRMWDFYMSYCEAAFMERYIGDVQMLFAKPFNRRAPVFF